MIGAIDPDDKQGRLEKWFPQVTDDPKLWEQRRRKITPNLIGRQTNSEIET
jgi:hypothetical protein